MTRLFPLFAITALAAHAEPAGRKFPRPFPEAIPGEAAISLTAAKSRYFLGEPFRVKFLLKNIGTKPLSFATGGDSRGSNRALRFRVRAVDEAGVVVPQADFPMMFGGGAYGAPQVLNPGESWNTELWALDYLKLTKPGKYTLLMTHDFGWNPGYGVTQNPGTADPFSSKDWKSPIGRLCVEFSVPDEKQIEAILDRIEEAIRKNDKETIPEPKDLAIPVYFAALKRRVEKGGPRLFLEAIASIPSSESTSELLTIAGRENHPLMLDAVESLFRRLPDIPPQWVPPGFAVEWDDAIKSTADAIARRLLSAYTKPELSRAEADRRVIAGARLATAFSTEADYEPLRAALEKVLERCPMPRRHRDITGDSSERPLSALLGAFDSLQKKNPRTYDDHFSGNAEILLRFRYAATDTEERRRRLIDHANTFGDTQNWMIRTAALHALPKPLPKEARPFVAASLDAYDPGIIAEACQVAGNSGDPSWIPDLLLVIRAENDEWAVRSAFEAARKLGARRDLAEALADRLIDTDLSQVALELLVRMSVKDTDSTGGDWRTHKAHAALQVAWKKWIREHAADLDAGVRFAPGDDRNLPAALFGLAVKWDIPGRGRWPR